MPQFQLKSFPKSSTFCLSDCCSLVLKYLDKFCELVLARPHSPLNILLLKWELVQICEQFVKFVSFPQSDGHYSRCRKCELFVPYLHKKKTLAFEKWYRFYLCILEYLFCYTFSYLCICIIYFLCICVNFYLISKLFFYFSYVVSSVLCFIHL